MVGERDEGKKMVDGPCGLFIGSRLGAHNVGACQESGFGTEYLQWERANYLIQAKTSGKSRELTTLSIADQTGRGDGRPVHGTNHTRKEFYPLSLAVDEADADCNALAPDPLRARRFYFDICTASQCPRMEMGMR